MNNADLRVEQVEEDAVPWLKYGLHDSQMQLSTESRWSFGFFIITARRLSQMIFFLVDHVLIEVHRLRILRLAAAKFLLRLYICSLKTGPWRARLHSL